MLKSLAFLTCLFIVTGCNLSSLPAAPQTQPTAISPTSEPAADLLTEEYADEQAGFALNYPAGWRVEPRPGEHVMLFSYPANHPLAVGGTEGVPPNLTKLDVILAHPGDPRSIEQEIADYEANPNGPGGQLIARETVTLPSGISGYKLTFTGGMAGDAEIFSYLLRFGERKLYATAYGDTTLLDVIVATLRGI